VLTPRQEELATLPELLSVAEAAHALRCNARTINRMVARGTLQKNGTSKRHSKITKQSVIVYTALHGDPVPPVAGIPVHDVAVRPEYEDAPESNEAQPVPEYQTEDADFAAQCKHFADLLPPVERRFLHAHPAPFNFEDYFR
jgi:hypothetical protein